jgi:hypothetical protein
LNQNVSTSSNIFFHDAFSNRLEYSACAFGIVFASGASGNRRGHSARQRLRDTRRRGLQIGEPFCPVLDAGADLGQPMPLLPRCGVLAAVLCEVDERLRAVVRTQSMVEHAFRAPEVSADFESQSSMTVPVASYMGQWCSDPF